VTRRWARHGYLGAAIVLGLFLAVFFNPIARHDATFSTVAVNQRNIYPWAAGNDPAPFPVQSDQAQYSHPRQVFLDHTLKAGVIPLWDPYTLGGHPFLASGPGLAYPPRLILTAMFGPSWAHDLYLVIHLFGAGMAMFAWMKQLRVRFLGALFGAVAWTFNAYSLTWVMLEPLAAVLALLPLALLFLRRWHDHESWPQLLLAGLALGLLYLGSSSELALVSFLLVAGYGAALAVLRVAGSSGRRSDVARIRPLAGPAVLVGVAMCVAAVGVLPFVNLIGRVHRASLPYSAYLDSTQIGLRRFSLSDFLRTLLPPVTPADASASVSQSAFVGTATALLALPALFLRRAGTGFGRGVTVITLLFIVGTPVTWFGYHLVPGLSSLNGLARCLFVWNLGVITLGGIGLDSAMSWLSLRVESRRTAGRPRARLPLVVGGVGILCVMFTAGQLLVYGRHANPRFQRRDPSLLFPPTPAVGALRQAQGAAPGEGRVLPVTRLPGGRPPADGSAFLALSGNAGQALDMRIVAGYENAVPDRTLRLWRYVGGESLQALSKPPTTTLNLLFPSTGVRTELLGRLGIAAAYAPPRLVTDDGWGEADILRKGLRQSYLAEDGVVLQVVDPAPRASVVTDAQVVSGADEALTALIAPGFDTRRSVILEGRSVPVADRGSPATADAPPIVWDAQGPNGARLTVTSATAGWLVLLESWDPGWRATVNGEASTVERADFAFQAIRIPAGTSAVELSYRPPEVLWGAALSGITVAAILVVVGVDASRRRRRPLPREPCGCRERPDGGWEG